jgi:microcystin-dependent protein
MKQTHFILVLVFVTFLSANKVTAQTGPFLGQIAMFAGNFAPSGWALCDGQLLAISSNTALFSLLGTTYGGDGQTTFALPDLRGRAAIHPGKGQGLTPKILGERGGSESVALTTANLPAHNHALNVSSAKATSNSPTAKYHADSGLFDKDYAATATDGVSMDAGAISNTGSNVPVSIMQPYLGMNYIIAVNADYPSRN